MIRRRKRIQPLSVMATMGDIAFQIIIFFVLTSTFMKQANIQLAQPGSPDVQKITKAPSVTVSADQSGVMRLQGQTMPVEMLKHAVEAILAGRDDRRVEVTVDRELPKEKYYPVIEAISSAGAEVMLAGQRED